MADKPKVLVTRRWPEAVEAKLKELYDVTLNESDVPMTADEMRQALMDYDAFCPTVSDKVDASVLDVSGARTKIIASYGVGYSHIDTDAAKKSGFVVTNTPEVLSNCTADLAITLMLAAARRIGEGERELRAGKWTGWRPTHMIGTRVSGGTFGVLGFGRIGREAARKAHFGFDMKVIYYDAFPVKPELAAETKAEARDAIEAVLKEADVISLHMPGGKENYHLINEARLKLMKPTAILVNTARGEVVDGDALAAALQAGTIAGAGLDVFEGEPKVLPSLLECENAVLLPHLGSATKSTREAMGWRVLENLEAYFKGEAPRDRVA
ncbi:Glycerate dehydrogenase [Hartmannibacter diazotrophicus]|uniref:Glycerate dehydrogenase n=1 Tax=Hartmannibacter diazotrophicus TaxID=1482074 RepID=A0A2C9D7N5_9HYPH|nr:D-glycerate dehydrogenase [Hartmannibacter diazotrophicus]SON55761.1 Glycerate dehydrogenase [Hartmannibacter diazotrophicus]